MHWHRIQGKHGDQSNPKHYLDTQVQSDHLWSNPLLCFTKTGEEPSFILRIFSLDWNSSFSGHPCLCLAQVPPQEYCFLCSLHGIVSYSLDLQDALQSLLYSYSRLLDCPPNLCSLVSHGFLRYILLLWASDFKTSSFSNPMVYSRSVSRHDPLFESS